MVWPDSNSSQTLLAFPLAILPKQTFVQIGTLFHV